MEVQMQFMLEVLLPILSEFYGLTYWGIFNSRDMITNSSSYHEQSKWKTENDKTYDWTSVRLFLLAHVLTEQDHCRKYWSDAQERQFMRGPNIRIYYV